ncbi:GLPGLI family protein [Flavobacterium micromati]|uniref:GLPGLI family protein n=2 Tax=Flavobacterium TaxID=237 RepID=A0A1M5QCR8_9FLAO|nr:GLPGLI family protein [Flavobacterium micromati]SHH11812.1 GLPGLI family protein [Flavobacterium micromati]
MKKLIIGLILISNIALSQNKDKSVDIKVIYEHSFFKGIFKNEVELYIKDNISQFSYNIDKQVKDNGNGKFTMAALKYINNYNLDTAIFREQRNINKKLITAEWKNDFKWVITKETKIINGYKAIKASSYSYEVDKNDPYYFGKVFAWFTTEIPLSAGPGRYAGLPGLILEIEYENSNSKYKLKSIDFKNKELLKDITKGTKVDKFEILYSREN